MTTRLRRTIYVLSLFAVMISACGGSAATAAPATTAAPAATAGAAATSAPVATEPPAAAEPIVLKVGQQGVADSLNPAAGVLSYSYRLYDLVYSVLLTEGPDGKYVGDLAESWEASGDGLTWTFKLKGNVKYHDGTPLTAEDVAWAINAIHNDPDGWALLTSYTNSFKDIEAVDPTTVQITLNEPVGNMEYLVSFLYAVKRSDFESFTTPEELQGYANDSMIGSGPFKLNTFDKDKGITILDVNPDYYGTIPKIDQVIFQTFDNNDALVQALKVGDIDATYEVPASAFATVKTFDNVKAVNTTARFFDELIINSTSDTNDPAPTGNPALKDPAVREAISLAINKQDIVDIVWQGLAKPAWSVVAPTLGGGFWFNPNIKDTGFDLDKANQLLEDASYKMGSDGVRAKGDVKLDMRLQYDATSTEYARTADLLKDWFGQIGLKVTPEAVDPDRLTELTTGVGDYDLVIWGWGADPDPDFILSIFITDQFVVGGWSDSGYSNPEYDQLYLDQQKAFKPEDRQKIIWKMQDLLFRDKPYIVLYNYDRLQAYRTDKFTNFLDDSPAMSIVSPFSLAQVEPVK
jgi:peptide/nickel transport system substrate-binding protein